jgi:hypothetical protein
VMTGDFLDKHAGRGASHFGHSLGNPDRALADTAVSRDRRPTGHQAAAALCRLPLAARAFADQGSPRAGGLSPRRPTALADRRTAISE